MTTLDELKRCLPARVARWAHIFTAAELCYDTDPFVLAAIIDRESLGGDALKPQGPGGVGDQGHGRGLGQIDDRAHRRFVAATDEQGAPLWADPVMNVLYAAKKLRQNLDYLVSDYPAAIAAYNASRERVRECVSALPAGASTIERIAALDKLTTGHDYVSDVLKRRARFLATPPRSIT